MLDSNLNTDRLARRTVLIAQELMRYDVDKVALAETRLTDEGNLTVDQAGYIFYWKAYATKERRIHGVGFAIKNKLVRLIEDIQAASLFAS